jgi:hypothetical protein
MAFRPHVVLEALRPVMVSRDVHLTCTRTAAAGMSTLQSIATTSSSGEVADICTPACAQMLRMQASP